MAMAPSVAASIPLLVLLLLTLPSCLLAEAPSDPQLVEDLPPPSTPLKCPDNTADLDRARAQLLDLERSLSDKDLALQEKGSVIVSLQTELDTLKQKDSPNNENLVNELSSKVARLEESLRKADAYLKNYKEKTKSLESSAAQLSSKIKQLEKVVADQKTKISRAEQALRVAESTLSRVQAEVDAKDKELRKVHGGWLPPWTVNKLSELQESAGDYWVTYCKPLVDSTTEKVCKKASTIWKSSKPHIETFKTRWSPVIKEQVETVSSAVAPHISAAKAQLVKSYEATRDYITPEFEKAHDFMKPHLEVVKDTCRPYVEEVASVLRPYLEQVKSATKPYRRKIFKVYREFLTTATSYHNQLQVTMQGNLKKVDILAPFVSNELVWFLASAALLLPVMIVSLFLSSVFSPRKKPVKQSKGHGNHAHRKPKRAKQADK